MENTLENVPHSLSLLHTKVDDLVKLVLNKPKEQGNDKLLTVEDAAKFLSLSVPTIYALNRKGELPVIKKNKRCYYLESDLLEYLKSGRRKSKLQIEEASKQYLKNNRLI